MQTVKNAEKKRLGYKFLAWARFCLALAVLCLFVRVYTSPLLQWAEVRIGLMNLQLSGALVRGGLLTFASALWLFGAAIFGRWFCGAVCPLGTAQEAVSRAARGILRIFHISNKKFSYISPWRFRFIFIFILVFIGAGVNLGLGIFDPIAIFGRAAQNFYIFASEGFINNLSTGVIIATAIPVVILAFAAARGRRFCDWCPVGIILGCLSGVAPFGMRLDKGRCVSCGACERACPVNCVDSKNKTIERGRCVMCLSCAGACHLGAVDYGPISYPQKEERRAVFPAGANGFAFICSAAYLAQTAFPRLTSYFISPTPPGFTGEILPPGAGDADNFRLRCIGCQSCAAACPVGVLRSGRGLKPSLDYSHGYCQYNCTECGRVCPTGAIRALSREVKQKTRIALSDFAKSNCVVVTRGESCGACAEVCPTRALRMVPVGDGSPLTVPEFDPTYCIGCGGCLNVCPAEPKVFTVRGVTPQVLTPGMRPSAPVEQGGGAEFKAGEEFPF